MSAAQVAAHPTSFESSSDELKYWKEKAIQYEKEIRDVRDELEEFQEGSRELEAELEAQLEQAENRHRDIKSTANRLTMENDQLKDKLEQCQREYAFQITELQTELSEIKEIKDQLQRYVRELEQQNDDLERAKRMTLASLEDFESRMNAAIERNAFLESELDEKETLKAAVQRMKEETRDLRSELKVLQPMAPSTHRIATPDNDKSMDEQDSNKFAADCETKPKSPSRSNGAANGHANGHAPGSPLTPSARISALNIVGDLLRKVGALELKLVSCRNIVKETPPGGSGKPVSASGTPVAAGGLDRSKRIPRGASTPNVKKLVDS